MFVYLQKNPDRYFCAKSTFKRELEVLQAKLDDVREYRKVYEVQLQGHENYSLKLALELKDASGEKKDFLERVLIREERRILEIMERIKELDEKEKKLFEKVKARQNTLNNFIFKISPFCIKTTT
jgi:flagellar motility protein MotE (MotC chaperone)